MAGVTEAATDVMLLALAAVAVKASLHTGDPGTNGANEISGGSYARQTISWVSDPSAGNLDSTNTPTFNVPAGNTVKFFGLWDSAGTVFYGGDLTTEVAFSSAGTYTLLTAALEIV